MCVSLQSFDVLLGLVCNVSATSLSLRDTALSSICELFQGWSTAVYFQRCQECLTSHARFLRSLRLFQVHQSLNICKTPPSEKNFYLKTPPVFGEGGVPTSRKARVVSVTFMEYKWYFVSPYSFPEVRGLDQWPNAPVHRCYGNRRSREVERSTRPVMNTGPPSGWQSEIVPTELTMHAFKIDF